MNFTSHSTTDTLNLAKKIASDLLGGEVLCLYGELGAGKTTFTKGLAQAFGITESITSPTFTLMNIYDTHPSQTESEVLRVKNIKTLIHIDAYRLKNVQELLEIGVEDYLGKPGVVMVIEWPEKIATWLNNQRVINLSFSATSATERTIRVEAP